MNRSPGPWAHPGKISRSHAEIVLPGPAEAGSVGSLECVRKAMLWIRGARADNTGT
jgi:hypothetical protein